MQSLENLTLFVKVVEIGSFINTAKVLKLNATTISRRISALERQLNMILIRKNTKNFQITEAGLQLYNTIKTEVRSIDKLHDKVNNILYAKSEPTGDLKIVLPTGLSFEMITPYLPQFIRSYPKINLHICYQNKPVDLIKEGLDIAIINHIPSQQTQKIKNIFSTKAKLYCTKEYIKKYGRATTPQELADHLVTGYISDYHVIANNLALTHEQLNTTEIIAMPKQLTSNSGLQNHQLLYSNEAIVFIFDNLDITKDKNIEPVLPDYYLLNTKYYLLTHPFHNDIKIKLFCKFIESLFNKDYDPII